jgi:hypothetical protein
MLKSSREIAKLPESNCSGSGEVCMSDDRCMHQYSRRVGLATCRTLFLVVTVFQGESPQAGLRWLCLAMEASYSFPC